MPNKGNLPADIPANPSQTYRNKGWLGWGDWLGTNRIASQKIKYRDFSEARSFARSLQLKKGTEWRLFCAGLLPEKGKLPVDIPANPYQTYSGKGWVGMGDWLGTYAVANHQRIYRPFKEAREFARGLKLKSSSEWASFCKGDFPAKGTLPSDIPVAADNVYSKKGWAGWGDWLGTDYVANQLRKYMPFSEAHAFARKLGLKSKEEWKLYARGMLSESLRVPQYMPKNPWNTYKGQGWAGIADWLGKE